MTASIATVTFLVRTYDEAIAWFTEKLGFELIADTDLGGGKRWVLAAPRGGSGARLLLAEASTDAQRAAIGGQTGGRVGFFLQTDNFAQDHSAFTAAGVTFRESPRRESYGTVAVFEDLYGNTWDLIEPKEK